MRDTILQSSSAEIPAPSPLIAVDYVSPTEPRPAIEPSPAEPPPVTESIWRHLVFGVIALAIAVGYLVVNLEYWVPAHGGVDQNGYLVGGKNLLHTGTMKARPADDFSFVGRMWVTGSEPGTYYPKYPIGLPAIYAVALAIGGVKLAYLVNPIAMSLALAATYLLVSRFTSAFYGLLAMLVVATSPVTTGLTNNPNSHATAICLVAWGMYLLFRWWELPKDGRAAWVRAAGAGLLLGYAVTIRYTEGLLLLPMGLVALFALWDAYRPGRHSVGQAFLPVSLPVLPPSSEINPGGETGRNACPTARGRLTPLYQSLALFAAWAVPVGALLIVNKVYFASWTGYDPTHESTGFSWENLTENWDTMLRQFYGTGLLFVFPLALIGLGMWFRHEARRAAVIAAWVLPCVFIYTVYYWAPDNDGIGYSRFFFTAFPALVAAGAIVMRACDRIHVSPRTLAAVAAVACVAGAAFGGVTSWKIDGGWGPTRGLVAGAVGGAVVGVMLFVRPASIVVMAGCALAAMASVASMENTLRANTGVWLAGQQIAGRVPAGSVVFSKDNVIHHAQFIGDWQFYSLDLFNENAVRNLARQSEDLDKEQPFQAERAKALYDLLKDERNPQLARRQNELMDRALAEGHRVFVLVPKREYDQAKNRFLPPRTYAASVVTAWDDPPPVAQPVKVVAGAARRPPRPPDRQQAWQLVEVTKATPTTAPATKPAPAPATKPVATAKPATIPAKPAAAIKLAPVTKPAAATRPAPAVARPATRPVVTTAPAVIKSVAATRPTTGASTKPATAPTPRLP